MLKKKFTEVPERYQDNINKFEEEALEQIAADIFDLSSISDLDKYFTHL